MTELVVVGGGFSGACLAAMVMRQSSEAVRITIVEPRATLGQGIAYQSCDPEHRINATVSSHSIIPDDADHLMRWCQHTGLLGRDPESSTPLGIFIRRSDYARYLHQSVSQCEPVNPATRFTHCRDRARVLELDPVNGYRVLTDRGDSLPADMIVLATGNPAPRLPAVLSPVAGHPALFANPWDRDRICQIDPQAAVGIIGAGLTTADILAGLISRGHRGPLLAFSRHGLRPARQAVSIQPVVAYTGNELAQKLNAPPVHWIQPVLAQAPNVRNLTRALRRQIEASRPQGEPWQTAFDDLRNAVWQIWPALSNQEKKRFLRHMRPWYDAHRFRIAPQTARWLDDAEQCGQLDFMTAKLGAIRAVDDRLALRLEPKRGESITHHVDALINCTGFDLGGLPACDSLIGRLLTAGQLQRDGSTMGFAVDGRGAAIDAHGIANPRLRLCGPPTAGRWGDPLGAVFIGMQIKRLLPDLLATLHDDTTRRQS